MRINTLKTWPEVFEIRHPRAIDGDTIEAWVVMPLDCCVVRRIRLKGFYAPEMEGALPDVAVNAKKALQDALNAKEGHLETTGLKEDSHGRIVAWLLLDGKRADPTAILGSGQLSETQHKLDLKFARSGGGRNVRSL